MALRKKTILINCDDLGYHPTINQAIAEILSQGIIRSASIMPAAPFYDDALRKLHEIGVGEVGVHLTLGSEYDCLPIGPLSMPVRVPSLINEKGVFHSDISCVREQLRTDEVVEELELQVAKVLCSGLRITHLDGHMFCYETGEGGQEILEIVETLSKRFGLPFRCLSESESKKVQNVYFIWAGHDTMHERTKFYRIFLERYSDELSELIIHPGNDLNKIEIFSRSGMRRYADYIFFRNKEFHNLIRQQHIKVVTWPEI